MTTPQSIQEHLFTDEFAWLSLDIKKNIITLLQHDTTILYPDAIDILEHCISQNIPFCLLSNLSGDYKDNIDKLIINPYTDYHNKLFTVLYSCDMGYKKPQPEAYEWAITFLKRQGVEEITMIGDNPQYDYKKPKELGLQAKWLNRRNKPHSFPVREVISSLDELV